MHRTTDRWLRATRTAPLVVSLAAVLASGCASSSAPPQPSYPRPPYATGYAQPYPAYGSAPQGYPQQAYPQQAYPQQPYPQQPYPQGSYPRAPYAPQPQAQQPRVTPAPPVQAPPYQAPRPVQTPVPPAAAVTPLLAPIAGSAAWQAEVKAVLTELIAHLSPQNQAKVRGIPLMLDPNPYEINAYAGCDEKGSPYLAATEGLLEAADALAQTHATDDLFGTQTAAAYANAVVPRLAQSDQASAALPTGIIPANLVNDPRRLSHAREWFDDLVAFTFGHELGHHYLGHTLCAVGQTMDNTPAVLVVPQLFTRVVPSFNQVNEVAADSAGVVNVLDTGRARLPGYRWSEKGALVLLDFFSQMDRAAGVSPLNPVGFLRTHPNPALRIPIVQGVARTWYLQHPG